MHHDSATYWRTEWRTGRRKGAIVGTRLTAAKLHLLSSREVQVAGEGVSAGSAIASGDAQRRAAHTNADIAKQRAETIAQQASVNEDAQRGRGAIAIGRGAAAASEGPGLDGSNMDVLKQSATNAEMDALNIRYQGKLGTLSANDPASMDNAQASDANSAG